MACAVANSFSPRENEKVEKFVPDSTDGEEEECCKIHIRNIPAGFKEEALRNIFSKYGTISEIYFKGKGSKWANVTYNNRA